MLISIVAGSETSGTLPPTLILLTITVLALAVGFPSSSAGFAEAVPKATAHWVSRDSIVWNVTPPQGATVWLEPGVEEGGQPIRLSPDPFGLGPVLREKFPHLVGAPVYRLADRDAARAVPWLKGPVRVVLKKDSTVLDLAGLQIAGVLDDLYNFQGRLGVEFLSGVPTLRVWAPTARSVALRRYEGPEPASPFTTHSMTEEPATGVWSVIGDLGWNRQYYLYEVEVYSPGVGRVQRNLVTDPYSLSLSADGREARSYGWTIPI